MSRFLLVFSILLGAGAMITLIPFAGAKEANLLHYRSLCSFAPVSTLIMLFLANTCYGIRKKKFLK